jgi:hypothetical protein
MTYLQLQPKLGALASAILAKLTKQKSSHIPRGPGIFYLPELHD